jgi:uncharacterized protein YicC (UPF0701 family)
MALKSMTGYGRGAATINGIRVEVELSSGNRKQLDIRLNLPRGAAALEPRLIEAIQHSVARGQITGEIVIHISDRLRRQGVFFDRVLAAAYLRAIRRAASPATAGSRPLSLSPGGCGCGLAGGRPGVAAGCAGPGEDALRGRTRPVR